MPDAEAPEAGGTAEPQLAALRAHLRRTEEERDAARLAAGHALPEPREELTPEAEAELERQLKEAQAKLADALARGAASAQQTAELAVLTARLEATKAKRRRVAADGAGTGNSTPRTPR